MTSNKPFDFGADPDRDSDPGIFNGILCYSGIYTYYTLHNT